MACPKCGSENYESKRLTQKVDCPGGDPVVTQIQNRCFQCKHVWSPAVN